MGGGGKLFLKQISQFAFATIEICIFFRCKTGGGGG
jgi:hypothetical protein